MPRGEHLKKVETEEIMRQFDRVDIDRNIYTAAEIAQGLDITAEATRQRLHNMKGEQVESEKIGDRTLWKKKGEEVFAGNLTATRQVFPKIGGIPASLYGAVMLLLVGVFLSVITGAAFTPQSFIIGLFIGAALGPIAIFLASLAIGIYQKQMGNPQ